MGSAATRSRRRAPRTRTSSSAGATPNLVEIDGAWQYAVRIARDSPWEAYLARLASSKSHDARLLGDERDPDGVRHMPFREAVLRSKEVPIVGFLLPRAARELQVSTRDSGQDSYDEHAAQWVRRSGVPERSSATREHRAVSIALRLFQTFDQVDLANSAGGEFLTCRLLQIEAATRGNPRQPDFEGWTASSTRRWTSTGRPSCRSSSTGSARNNAPRPRSSRRDGSGARSKPRSRRRRRPRRAARRARRAEAESRRTDRRPTASLRHRRPQRRPAPPSRSPRRPQFWLGMVSRLEKAVEGATGDHDRRPHYGLAARAIPFRCRTRWCMLSARRASSRGTRAAASGPLTFERGTQHGRSTPSRLAPRSAARRRRRPDSVSERRLGQTSIGDRGVR